MDEERRQQGLSEKQVELRISQGKVNTPVDAPSKSVHEIIATNVFTYFNFIFAIIAALLISVGAFRELTFLPVIIGNTLIGIIQEYRSKKVLDKLSVLNSPKSHVLRDGKEIVIPAEKLVLDDIVVFYAGNQIPADAVVIEGEVQVNESLITGEADEVTKKENSTLLSGSYIVSGTCYARLTKVGSDSYVSKLTLEAKAVKKGEQSEMMRSLDKLVKVIGFLILPIGGILFYQQYILADNTLRKSIISMTAAVIGMIPEGLYLLASVALVVSVMKLAQKKVLVHDMKCIETLARVNVLCVDKTGTITENKMKVRRVLNVEGEEDLKGILTDFAQNMPSDNATMQAIQHYFNGKSTKKADKITTFSSVYKYSSATFDGVTYVLGAPEFVLREQIGELEKRISLWSKKGYRVLAFGIYDGETDGSELTEEVKTLALILLTNPIRKEARDTFHYFEEQNVEIKVISGDNPITVSKVALEAGIKGARRYIDATKLSTVEEIEEAVEQYVVFGRVTPIQKRQIVQALKKAGKTVAMTGDGVNDVLALKDADCSIAMASGSDVASQASQLVLLESNFACMPSVVAEGRQVVNNIERSASLFLVKNIFSILLSIMAISFAIIYPLRPAQVSLIGMMTIGTPAFLLAMEPNTKLIRGNFLKNVFFKALPAGLTDVIMVGILMLFGKIFKVSSEEISVTSTLLLAVVGLQILHKLSKPMNKFRWIVWYGMAAGLIICSLFLGDLFGIRTITLESAMLLLVFSLATIPIFTYLTYLVKKLEKVYGKKRKKRKKSHEKVDITKDA